MKWATSFRADARTPLLQVGKSALAAIATWLICILIFPDQVVVFGPIAAIICVLPTAVQTLTKAIERIVGVTIGVAVSSALIILLGGGTNWIFAVIIAVCMLVGWALRLSPTTATQIAITGMLVFALGGSDPSYAIHRILATLVGAVVGTGINILIPPPSLLLKVHASAVALAANMADALDRLAEALTRPQDTAALNEMLTRSRALRDQRIATRKQVQAGEESLQYNIRRRTEQARIERDVELFERLDAVLIRVRGMTRTLRDHYSPELPGSPLALEIAARLRRAAHDLRGHAGIDTGPEAATPGVTGATAPIPTEQQPPNDWILYGALLEDLRRIYEAIEDADPS